MSNLSEQDKALIRAMSGGLPLSETPYREVAARAGLTEAEALEKVRAWLADGLIRRLTGVVHHRRSGYNSNAMVVWDVPPERLEATGKLFASRPEVTHCYERPRTERWPYGLYTMVHARDEEGLQSLIEDMALDAGARNYRVLKTGREYKKEPVRYFSDGESEP